MQAEHSRQASDEFAWNGHVCRNQSLAFTANSILRRVYAGVTTSSMILTSGGEFLAVGIGPTTSCMAERIFLRSCATAASAHRARARRSVLDRGSTGLF